jgi:preprotein translocase subunit SecD
VGRSLVIVFDKEVLSAPVIREPVLTDTAQIAGAFTVEQSVDIATLLRAGELPARLVVIVGDSSD